MGMYPRMNRETETKARPPVSTIQVYHIKVYHSISFYLILGWNRGTTGTRILSYPKYAETSIKITVSYETVYPQNQNIFKTFVPLVPFVPFN